MKGRVRMRVRIRMLVRVMVRVSDAAMTIVTPIPCKQRWIFEDGLK